MAINPMNTLTIIENIFCVNRNYCILTKSQRLILGLRLLFEIAIIGIPLVQFHFNINTNLPKTEHLFFALSVLSAFAIIFLAPYYSKDFQNLKFHIEKSHQYFGKDTVYSRNVNKKLKFTAFVLGVYLILISGVVVLVDILTKSDHLVSHLYHVIMMLYNLRYIFEFFVLHCILLLLSEQVKCITRKISNERKLILHEDDEDITINGEIVQEVTGFDEWTKVYTNIKECSNLVNTVFGVQITVSLTSMIFFFIIFLYVITSMSISDYNSVTLRVRVHINKCERAPTQYAMPTEFEGKWEAESLSAGLLLPTLLHLGYIKSFFCFGNIVTSTILVYTIKVIVLLISLYALSRGAQTAENSANDLRRCLGKLLIYSPIEDGSYKAIKDILRLVTNRPIKTQAFGSIDVDMTLVPKFVMFFTSYTVIALQFNNVV